MFLLKTVFITNINIGYHVSLAYLYMSEKVYCIANLHNKNQKINQNAPVYLKRNFRHFDRKTKTTGIKVKSFTHLVKELLNLC